MESASSSGPTYAQVVGVEPDRPPSFLNGITITAGNLSLPRGTVAPYQGQVTIDYVGNAISNFATTITIQRIIYLALSTPVLLLGVYLGAIGVDLGHAERRRELAVLKTRGATPRQLVGLLLVEAALGGAIAAIVGLVA